VSSVIHTLNNALLTYKPKVPRIDCNIAVKNWIPSSAEKCSVLVATPSVVARTIQSHDYWRHLNYVVVDEADMLLDGNYAPDVHEIIYSLDKRMLCNGETKRQYLFVGATLPHAAKYSPGRWLDKHFKNAERVKVQGYHETNPLVDIEWLDVIDEEEKVKRVLSAISKGHKNTLIFVNSADNAASLTQQLERMTSTPVLSFHSNMNTEERLKALSLFAELDRSIMVATDVASRGLDIINVDHVIQADFALDAIRYLHRIGKISITLYCNVCIYNINVCMYMH
jgi:ATP-dependent RNA helicase RhlE